MIEPKPSEEVAYGCRTTVLVYGADDGFNCSRHCSIRDTRRAGIQDHTSIEAVFSADKS